MTRKSSLIACVLGLLTAISLAAPAAPRQGCLEAIGPDAKPLGPCPLKHTEVKAYLSGFTAYVQVEQVFENPYDDKIEAIYTFPLGSDAAVSEMTMQVGDRVIFGSIKPRDEAKQIYEEAKEAGHVAGLLDQERPNIFTQAVANIEPGKKITITIAYSETLDYDAGASQWVFPMVVGPRYVPGSGPVPTHRRGDIEPAPKPSSQVDEADKVNPPVTPKGARAGHDISVSVLLHPGMALKQVDSALHEIDLQWLNPEHTRAKVTLAGKDEIPNKDFVLRFSTASDEIADAMLTHTDDQWGYFTLMLQPPARPEVGQIVGRELMFVIDTSGSQKGFPLSLSRKIVTRAIENLRPGDRFNVMRFANSAGKLFDSFVENSESNRDKALAFVQGLKASGGTRMAGAMNACLTGQAPEGMVRIVAFFTDGYVANDMEMIDIVRENAAGTRVFVFGTGKSVNRYCIDGIAQAGRGQAEYVLQSQGAEKKADAFYQRIDAPVLTDITIDWGELSEHVQLDEVYPRVIPDLFSVKPVILKGRFATGDSDVTGTITIRGRSGGGDFSRELEVTLPARDRGDPVLPQQWARSKVEHLMASDLRGMQRGNPDEKVKEQIIDLGVEYGIMTRFTSFVAVEEKTVTLGGKPRKVQVPVELPEGVSYEGIFGEGGDGRARGVFGPMGGAGGGVANRRMMLQAAPATGAAPAAGRPTAKKQAARREAESDREDAAEAARPEPKPMTPEQKREQAVRTKLAEVLRGLEKKLDADGDYAKGSVIVKDGKVEVAIYLREMSDEAVRKLTDLGFQKILDAPAAKMVLGSIEVSKLADAAMLDVVRLIDVPKLAD